MDGQNLPSSVESPAHTESLIERVADRIAHAADVRAVYGAPVERDGTTVIPVASVRYGFGGGGGHKASRGDEGSGGGAGVVISPLGFIELSNGEAAFRKIHTGTGLMRALGIGLGFGMFALARLLGGVLQRQRWRTAFRRLPRRERRRLSRHFRALRLR